MLHEQWGKGDKSAQKIGEKEVLHETLVEKKEASSKDEGSEENSQKAQEEREAFEKYLTKLEKKERTKNAETKKEEGGRC